MVLVPNGSLQFPHKASFFFQGKLPSSKLTDRMICSFSSLYLKSKGVFEEPLVLIEVPRPAGLLPMVCSCFFDGVLMTSSVKFTEPCEKAKTETLLQLGWK